MDINSHPHGRKWVGISCRLTEEFQFSAPKDRTSGLEKNPPTQWHTHNKTLFKNSVMVVVDITIRLNKILR